MLIWIVVVSVNNVIRSVKLVKLPIVIVQPVKTLINKLLVVLSVYQMPSLMLVMGDYAHNVYLSVVAVKPPIPIV